MPPVNNNNNNMSRQSAKVAPAKQGCKVCKDAGLPESFWSNHSVRNAKGQLCCPTLKSTCCKNCNKPGHTAKYCTVQQTDRAKEALKFERERLFRDAAEVKAMKQTPVFKNGQPVKPKPSGTGAFDALVDSDSDEEPEAVPDSPKRVASKTSCPPAPRKRASVMNWADDSDDDDEQEVAPKKEGMKPAWANAWAKGEIARVLATAAAREEVWETR